MADFPTKGALSQGESPTLYKWTPEDPAIKADTDGGYEFRRRRFTRTPRASFQTGFLKLPHADYLKLLDFYNTHTTVDAFNWTDYLMNITYQVRFDTFVPSYQGVGTNRMWDVTITMSEV